MLALGRGRNSPSERPRGTAGDRNTCEVCTWSLGTQHLPELLMSLEGYPPTLLPHWLTSPSKNNNGMWVERSETGYLWVQRHAKPKGRGMRSRHWRQKKQLRFTARATQSGFQSRFHRRDINTSHSPVAFATPAILHRSTLYGKAICLPCFLQRHLPLKALLHQNREPPRFISGVPSTKARLLSELSGTWTSQVESQDPADEGLLWWHPWMIWEWGLG